MNKELPYYVYYVRLKEDIIYIGKGKGNRCDHVLSGNSHNRKLNEYYWRSELLGEDLPAVAKERFFPSSCAALSFESEKIMEHLPECNIRGKSTSLRDEEDILINHPYEGACTSDIFRMQIKAYSEYLSASTSTKCTFSFYSFFLGRMKNTYYGKTYLTEVYEDFKEYIDSFEGVTGRPPKFQLVFDMNEAEKKAYQRYFGKLGYKMKDLLVDNEYHYSMVEDWINARRSK